MTKDPLLESCLPAAVVAKLSEYKTVNEIRIRKGQPLCFTSENKNYVTDLIITKSDIEHCILKFCRGSLHSYFEYIKKGFIPYGEGYRIGVCGKAVQENGKIISLSEITGLNIRIPQANISIPKDFIRQLPYEKGLLIYSPANTGKTTFLKVISSVLSRPPHNKKVVVIDCKHELYSKELHSNNSIDFFFGYPKYEAIDMAIRNMSPEIIICDEIGLNDDVNKLIECKNCGVSLICTAHAGSIEELLLRKNIKTMHDHKIFKGYVGISFSKNQRTYSYTDRKDIKC